MLKEELLTNTRNKIRSPLIKQYQVIFTGVIGGIQQNAERLQVN